MGHSNRPCVEVRGSLKLSLNGRATVSLKASSNGRPKVSLKASQIGSTDTYSNHPQMEVQHFIQIVLERMFNSFIQSVVKWMYTSALELSSHGRRQVRSNRLRLEGANAHSNRPLLDKHKVHSVRPGTDVQQFSQIVF